MMEKNESVEELRARYRASTTWLYPLATWGVAEIFYLIELLRPLPHAIYHVFPFVKLGILFWAFSRIIPAWKDSMKYSGVRIHAIIGTLILAALVTAFLYFFYYEAPEE